MTGWHAAAWVIFGWAIGVSTGIIFATIKPYYANPQIQKPPYPWCKGNPSKQDCINSGYCQRDPNCGE